MEELSLSKLKQFAALRERKTRLEQQLYLAEGRKLVAEALTQPRQPEAIVVEEGVDWQPFTQPNCPVYRVRKGHFARLTDQASPEGVMAVMALPAVPQQLPVVGPAFVLAGIQDPGNVGTLLRIADWFGLKAVYAGPGTADAFAPKVVRASMGALFRVPVYSVANLPEWLAGQAHRSYAATLGGQPLPEGGLPADAWILLGNESQGLGPELLRIPGLQTVSIPRRGRAESLNVAVAGGILAHALKG